MRKLIPFFLCILLLIGCQRSNDPLTRVSELMDTDVCDYQVIKYYDSHGSWLGDGQTIIICELTEEQAIRLNEDTKQNIHRKALPFSAPIETSLYGGTIIRGGVEWRRSAMFMKEDKIPLVPKIESGFYLFKDRHGESTDPCDASDLLNRGSYNFDLAVFDADTNTLYYLVMDT